MSPVALAGAVILLGLLAACGGDDATPPTTTTEAPSTTTTEAPSTTEPFGEPVDVTLLVEGDCFEERVIAGQGQIDIQETVRIDCDDPHFNEVYLVTQLPDEAGTPFPGTEAVNDVADQTCIDAFEAFVGVQYELSEWEIGHIVPTEETWVLPDRQVVCFVFDRSGDKTTGSAEGSER
jgi:hypothetical protein